MRARRDWRAGAARLAQANAGASAARDAFARVAAFMRAPILNASAKLVQYRDHASAAASVQQKIRKVYNALPSAFRMSQLLPFIMEARYEPSNQSSGKAAVAALQNPHRCRRKSFRDARDQEARSSRNHSSASPVPQAWPGASCPRSMGRPSGASACASRRECISEHR